jgi:hypothetical protein
VLGDDFDEFLRDVDHLARGFAGEDFRHRLAAQRHGDVRILRTPIYYFFLTLVIEPE